MASFHLRNISDGKAPHDPFEHVRKFKPRPPEEKAGGLRPSMPHADADISPSDSIQGESSVDKRYIAALHSRKLYFDDIFTSAYQRLTAANPSLLELANEYYLNEYCRFFFSIIMTVQSRNILDPLFNISNKCLDTYRELSEPEKLPHLKGIMLNTFSETLASNMRQDETYEVLFPEILDPLISCKPAYQWLSDSITFSFLVGCGREAKKHKVEAAQAYVLLAIPLLQATSLNAKQKAEAKDEMFKLYPDALAAGIAFADLFGYVIPVEEIFNKFAFRTAIRVCRNLLDSLVSHVDKDRRKHGDKWPQRYFENFTEPYLRKLGEKPARKIQNT